MERKIKTLNEVLNLNRRPTLQEIVDLSDEDYARYLYGKGVIKYIPESRNINDYKPIEENDDYYPEYDPALEIKSPDFEFNFDVDSKAWLSDEQLNEDLNDDVIERGIVQVNDKKYYYDIWECGWTTIYQIRSDGKKHRILSGEIGYMQTQSL